MSNIKAALKGLVTLGEMKELLVNNGLCNIPGQYFLDAAFGKNLQDQGTDVNNKTEHMFKNFGATTDPDTIDKSGIYYFTAGTIHAPETNNGYIVLHFESTNRICQIATINGKSSNYYIRIKATFDSIYSDWKKIITAPDLEYLTGNGPGSFSIDLNTIKNPGVHWVSISGTGNKPKDFNYPKDSVNGWLHVLKKDDAIEQIFYRYGTINTTGNYMYTRNFHKEANNTWSDWMEIITDYSYRQPNKQLWTGTFEQGSITVPEFEKYTLFRITLLNKATDIVATHHTDHLRGIGGFTDGKGASGFFFNANVSGNVITLVACTEFGFGNNSIKSSTVSGIYGLC